MEKQELTYKSAMAELETIIRTMESENCEIDRLAEYTSRATVLLKFCKESLFKTNEEVEACLEELKRLV
ncbi:MAG: exodeoxyribonuclease VII small subunit [Bacteroides sp.]|nr:exodeoxyribonuclease VII small subunit [Bacteroides sp.]MDE6257453.1 exodeoxyribonuclease VII small subunit [Muribaculaceae bacterium]